MLSDAAPFAPIEELVLVTDAEQVPTMPRIRRPRWTPTYTLITPNDDVVAGELDVTSRRS